MKSKMRLLFTLILLLNALTHPPGEGEATYIYTSETSYVNQGAHNINLDEGFRCLNLFPNSSWQTTYLTSVNRPHRLEVDEDGNRVLDLEVSTIHPGGNVSISYTMKILARSRKIPDIRVEDSSELKCIPSQLEEHCEGEGSWLVEDEELMSLAEHIYSSENTSSVLKIVIAIADWIGRNIKDESHEVPLYPNETYQLRSGDCDDQSNLLITLCRILRIPAILRVGCMSRAGYESESTYWEGHVKSILKDIRYHAWALIYIPPWGWLPFDMTLGWRESNPLKGISEAVAWRRDTIVMLDVIHSDWAGEGGWQRDYTISQPIYIHSRDRIVPLHRGFEAVWERIEFWIIVSAIILLSAGYLGLRKHSKSQT